MLKENNHLNHVIGGNSNLTAGKHQKIKPQVLVKFYKNRPTEKYHRGTQETRLYLSVYFHDFVNKRTTWV